MDNLSADIIRQAHPWSSYRCFVLAPATRCQAGRNIKQRALTLNGRTPATKATTKRLPLTAFPLPSAFYMTPAPSWKKISAPLLWTRCQSLERAQKQRSQNEHWQAEIEGGVMEEGTVHLPVNLDKVFLSGEALDERWSEVPGDKAEREGAATWPRVMFRKSFTEKTQQPGPNWTPLRSKPSMQPLNASMALPTVCSNLEYCDL